MVSWGSAAACMHTLFTLALGVNLESPVDLKMHVFGTCGRKWEYQEKHGVKTGDHLVVKQLKSALLPIDPIHQISVKYSVKRKKGLRRSSIFTRRLSEVGETITSWALRRPSYFNYIVPKLPRPISLPFPQPLPFTNTHKTASHYTLTSPLPAPCNYTIGRKHLFLGSVNVWLLLASTRLREQSGVFHYKIFNSSNFIVQFGDFMIRRRLLELRAFPVSAIIQEKTGSTQCSRRNRCN